MRCLPLVLILAVLVEPLAAEAQPVARVYRIGMLEPTSNARDVANLNAFRQGLRELGYVEGQNFVIEHRSADGRDERFPDLATELILLKVDLIVTRGTPAVLAIKRLAPTIPVVMAANRDPVATGVVASLAHPGGYVTGLSVLSTELSAKRFELIREIVPRISRVAVLLNMGQPANPPQWKEAKAAARSQGVQPQLLDVRRAEDLGPAFESAIAQHAGALVVGLASLTRANREAIADLAAKHRLPAIYAATDFADVGGLISYGVSYPDLYRRAASLTDKILKGAKPGDLPVEQATKFELVINLKTAKALGLTIPPSLLQRADQVIE